MAAPRISVHIIHAALNASDRSLGICARPAEEPAADLPLRMCLLIAAFIIRRVLELALRFLVADDRRARLHLSVPLLSRD